MVAGGVSGGMVWALTAAALGPPAVLLGVGVGAAVLGAKAVTGLFVNRDEPKRTPLPELPRPPRGSAAAFWLSRAEAAVRSRREMAGTSTPGITGDSVRSAAEEASQTLVEMSQVAGQVTA